MQATQTMQATRSIQTVRGIDQADSGRILAAAASAIVVVILVVAFVLVSMGLGYEGSTDHRPMPAPRALEAH